MLNAQDQENVTKATQCVALLVADIGGLATSNNPQLPEISSVALAKAERLEQDLKGIEAVSISI